MSGLMKRCWSTVPKEHSAGCLLFWCVGYMPMGAERKRFNNWALGQMKAYYLWEMKQCQKKKSGSGAATTAAAAKKTATARSRTLSTSGNGKRG